MSDLLESLELASDHASRLEVYCDHLRGNLALETPTCKPKVVLDPNAKWRFEAAALRLFEALTAAGQREFLRQAIDGGELPKHLRAPMLTMLDTAD